MVIKGSLVDMLIQIEPEIHQLQYFIEKGKKVLYLHVKKAIYGMLQSGLLYYQKFRKDIEEYRFRINPYDPCVVSKIVNGKQLTIAWHSDDLKASHVQERVLDEFIEWLKSNYGSYVSKVKVHKGKVHDYLAMNLDYTVKEQVKIDMIKYVKDMIKDFPEQINKSHITPASEKLFSIHQSSELNDKRKDSFIIL